MTLVDGHIESCIVAGILEVIELGILSCAPAASIIESDKIANFFIMFFDFKDYIFQNLYFKKLLRVCV